MKSWKDQLKDLKRVLGKAAIEEKRNEKLDKVSFEPPRSWLAYDRTTSDDDPKKCSGSTAISHDESSHRRCVPTVDTSTGLNPIDQSITPSVIGTSAKKSHEPSRTTATSVFTPRIDGTGTLNMPEGTHVGRGLQHPDHLGGKAVPMVVRVGVDFGTAFTKVAIRAGYDLIYVDWSAITCDESPTGRFVMPGLVVRVLEGDYCWQRSSESDIHANLKLPLIDMASSGECPVATLAYLALVIRYARAYLYQHPDVGRKLVARSLRWELNIGCPTQPHEDLNVVQFFKRVSRTAWRLAAEANLQESNIISAWRMDQPDSSLEAEPGVVPEFVAQIAGYLGSHQVSEGLHALIDIGAATIDVATFNVVIHNNLDTIPRIPIFFSAVFPLGTHYLNQNRHTLLGVEPTWDDTAPIEPADCFSNRNGISQSEVVAADSDFLSGVSSRIDGVINATRTNTRGDPRSSAWREGLPIFVTGGGASCDLYRRAIEMAHQDLRRRLSSSSRFRFVELNPLGTNIPVSASDSSARMTVAIGLTSDADSIARVVPHRDIKPITYGKKERVDHTELYGD
ncbi:MAG: hypothetical protein F4X93_00855 [Proteobacteria bacterium]|nr:hypothetical protein [Pseudomonadota bacterium]